MAGPEPLRLLSRRAWEPALARARRAALLLDAPAAEALHWAGGAGELLAAGALAVRALSAEATVAAGAARVVFVLSGALRGGAAAAVRAVLGQGAVRHCVLVCGGEQEGGGPAELEETLRRWMGEGGHAEVVLRGTPLLAPVSTELCLLPALATLLPPLSGLGGPGPAEVGLGGLPAELRTAVRALVGDLDDLFSALGLREENFAVGALSRIVAAELAGYAPARNRRRTATNKASVVFVDRTLDLAGKTSTAEWVPVIPAGPHPPHQKGIRLFWWPGNMFDTMAMVVAFTSLHPSGSRKPRVKQKAGNLFVSGTSTLLQTRDLNCACVSS
ncbi:sec1 family domain-containing protein 2-like protein [Pitangus sulphuratus]|nr:sec1 family domain-containing protein 2-like protein [Pitangus sulphuratus]